MSAILDSRLRGNDKTRSQSEGILGSFLANVFLPTGTMSIMSKVNHDLAAEGVAELEVSSAFEANASTRGEYYGIDWNYDP